MELTHVMSGALGALLVLLVQQLAKVFTGGIPVNKDFYWAEMLSKTKFTDAEINKMYLASVTFGECATGELLGSLDRLQKVLPQADFAYFHSLHATFGQAIATMYHLKAKRDNPLFEKLRVSALATFRQMEDFKREMGLEYQDPNPHVVITPAIPY